MADAEKGAEAPPQESGEKRWKEARRRSAALAACAAAALVAAATCGFRSATSLDQSEAMQLATAAIAFGTAALACLAGSISFWFVARGYCARHDAMFCEICRARRALIAEERERLEELGEQERLRRARAIAERELAKERSRSG